MSRLTLLTPPGFSPFGGTNGHPDYLKNRRDREPHECCVVCGKKTPKTAKSVMLSTLNEYLTELGENDLGYYPVGPECSKALKAAGIPVVKAS